MHESTARREDSSRGGFRPDLRQELLKRHDADGAARSTLLAGDRQAYARLVQLDDENAAWLATVLDAVGWPGHSLVGEDGAHAAWLLAQHADRHPSLQRRSLKLLQQAVARGEASSADLARLTDRVLLARGKQQIYGTQINAQDGQYVACRLQDPETVNDRRISAGLESLESYLRCALEEFGPPSPALLQCRGCHREIEVWLPEIGGRVTFKCPSCGFAATIRAYFPTS